MEILLAKHAGFCFGVERAIEIVDDAAYKYDNVHTLGPIIHNPQVVEEFNRKGVTVTENITDISVDDTIVLRSHGVEKDIRENLNKKGVKVIDAVCPFVEKAHDKAKDLSDEGYFVVILGEKDHPEVKSIVSYIEGDFIVVSDDKDAAENILFNDKIGLVAQTTQSKGIFDKTVDILSSRCNSLKIVNTICNATTLRQKAATELAKEVDLMFVVGGRNSANTTRLYKICNDICGRAYHIETKEDIDKTVLIGVQKVGITAGASTPKNIIEDVVEYIKEVDNAR